METSTPHNSITTKHFENLGMLFDNNTSYSQPFIDRIIALCILMKLRKNNNVAVLNTYFDGLNIGTHSAIDTIISPPLLQWTKQYPDPLNITIFFQQLFL